MARVYGDGTKKIPSVTEILGRNLGWGSDGLRRWAVSIAMDGGDPDVESRTAMAAGTKLHDDIERYVKGEDVTHPEDFDEQPKLLFEAWRAWFDSKADDIAFRAMEESLVGVDDGTGIEYGGTPDVICDIKDVTTVVDWKTANDSKAKPNHFLQVAAYASLWNAKEKMLSESSDHAPTFVTQGLIIVVNKKDFTVKEHWLSERMLHRALQAWECVLFLEKIGKEFMPSNLKKESLS